MISGFTTQLIGQVIIIGHSSLVTIFQSNVKILFVSGIVLRSALNTHTRPPNTREVEREDAARDKVFIPNLMNDEHTEGGGVAGADAPCPIVV
mmetsp:Transcript_43967/g.106609  ORF Transcript_43967/g.106609 Transcript_43967/m.106609 type:complete len:93 (-) Transcript_43967:103-381(-)